MYFQMADTVEERRSHWTCYICKRKAPIHSLDSQGRQVHEIIVGWYINNNKSKKLDFKQ